ncbi:hypothetical protein [Oceanisphaera pacifica]|uniref:TIGR03503 family protein n=1 Tax=Oceanisphaera pacifica TaxID=2818389 RepID=A0ABS3NGV7_9GAMM|nr:hypothetical protein [Oceanisphaera pacifica]MBO1519824.1 hypothetical protein [Oceanisphaera pacifica]
MAHLTSRSLMLGALLLITFFSTASEQSARWLSNTFRIDPSVSSVTLFIERELESSPVVLIRPDGSKYYHQDHPDNISWASSTNRDVITLWQPEPGPWQATGKVNKNRGISLVSEFSLVTTPLANRLYQQEILKINAELQHNNTRLDANYYLKDLSLQAQLINLKDDYEAQFAPAPLVIGKFMDDGLALDAYPNDGEMTAEVVLDTLPGEYLYQVTISNEVLARTQEQTVLIYPMPLKVNFSTPNALSKWQINTQADHELVADSLVVTGELTTPSQQRIPISGTGKIINLPDALESGNYYWKGQAFVTNTEGREIQLNLAKQVIRVSPPVSITDDVVVKERPMNMLPIIIGAVSTLLLLAAIVWLIRKRKKSKAQPQTK